MIHITTQEVCNHLHFECLFSAQKIWSGELTAQKLTRDNDLRLYYGLKLHTYIKDKSAEDGLIFKDSLFHNKQVGSSVSPIKAVLSTHNQLYYTSCDHIQKPMTHPCVPVLKIFGHGIILIQPIMLGLSSTNQVHSLLPRYICKGLTYLWSTDLLDIRTFLNMKESIP